MMSTKSCLITVTWCGRMTITEQRWVDVSLLPKLMGSRCSFPLPVTAFIRPCSTWASAAVIGRLRVYRPARGAWASVPGISVWVEILCIMVSR